MLRTSTEKLEIQNIQGSNLVTSNLLSFRLDPEQAEEFLGLCDSIRKYGLLQPIIVRKQEFDRENGFPTTLMYQVVSGYRRFLACKKLGLTHIACIVKELNDQEAFEVALVENLQRQSLNPIEEAEAFKSYVLNFGRGSVTRLALKIGKSEEYVSHRLLLLGLPKLLVDRISRRLLNPSHATELVWLKNENQQIVLSGEIVKNNLSHKEVRCIIKLVKREGMAVNKAVENVLQRRDNAMSSQSDNQSNYETGSPWIKYEDNIHSSGKDISNEKKILTRAILSVRACLCDLDRLIDQTTDKNLTTLLMNERRSVHTILDELIRSAKVKGNSRITVPQTV